MNQSNYITKEYLKEHLDKRFHELRADLHSVTEFLLENAKAHYKSENDREKGALREGFRGDLQIVVDQVKSVTDKTDDHESRICKIEKAVL